MKFTDSMIRALKPREKRYEVWEGRGFGIRIAESGEKSFVYLYRYQGKARRLTLGRYPAMTLTEAHAAHVKARQSLEQNIDPGRTAIEARAADRKAFTVKDLVGEYLEKWAMSRKRTWKEDRRCLEREVLPEIGDKKAKEVRRRDIILILDKIVARGSGGMANRVLNVVSKMFSFAVSRDILDTSPCVAIAMPAKKNQRERVLSEDEIKRFWFGLGEARMCDCIKLALKFQLITAQRRGEVAQAEWREIDLKNGWWTVPARKAKNNLTHRVPLSQTALQVLGEIKAQSKDSCWVFRSPTGDKPITAKAITRSVKKNADVFGIPRFTPHDLRRTAASLMTGAGISRLTVSKILNHAESGITAVYDRHSYDNEKRQALDTWARKLEAILTGQTAKVIPLQR